MFVIELDEDIKYLAKPQTEIEPVSTLIIMSLENCQLRAERGEHTRDHLHIKSTRSERLV